MRLKTLAELAAIVAVIIGALQYMKVEPNALDKISDKAKELAEAELETVEISIIDEDYLNKNSFAYPMYKAALGIPYPSDKSTALQKVVAAAIEERDFKLAIAVANKIPYTSDKSEALKKVAYSAMNSRENLKFSVIAAEFIPYPSAKNDVLKNVSNAYEFVKSGGSLTEFVSTLNKPKGKLEEYKEIYRFADSGSYMAMSENDAKIFTDDWQLNRTYEQFILFKGIYTFADSSSYMSLSEEEAKNFAFEWLKKYGSSEFEVYKDAFKFAYSGSYMDMNEVEAKDFALSKVEELKKSNKIIQPTLNGSG